MGTEVPRREGVGPGYVQHGRSGQKRRTYEALVDAARRELARGHAVTVESVAALAGISRTTAYRYFTNHRELVAAAHPQIDMTSLLPAAGLTDPAERLAAVMHTFIHDVTLAWEPQLRTALHLALTPRPKADDGTPDPGTSDAGTPDPGTPDPGTPDAGTLRRGRGIGWIVDALAPLRETRPEIDLELLARAIRSAAGIEALIWLTDVGGLSRHEAARVMHGSAMAILDSTLRPSGPPAPPPG